MQLTARLSSLLGAPAGAELEESHLRRLVEVGAREDTDLEFKSSHYPPSKNDELAKDVAAMLNAGGGLLIIGIHEDEQARASSLTPVEVTDGAVRRIVQVVAERVRPFAKLEIEIVRVADGDDRGYIAVGVPRSSVAPHSARRSELMSFPIRNGATTRYLDEAELGEHYRRRFAAVQGQAERLEAADGRLQRTLRRDNHPWFTIAAIPEAPGDLRIDRAAFDDFQSRYREAPLLPYGGHSAFHRFGVGPGRMWATSTVDPDPRPDWGYLETDEDGSGAYAVVTPTTNSSEGVLGIDQELIALGAMRGLPELARGARRAGAGGVLAFRARLLDSSGSRTAPLQLQRPDTFGFHPVSVPLPAEDRWYLACDGVGELDDLEAGGRAMMRVLAGVLDRLFHCFGVPEQSLVTSSGEIVRAAWARSTMDMLRPWIEAHEIAVV